MPKGPHNEHKFAMGSNIVPLDREAAYSIAIALTELHSRRCNQAMMCGDMQESTEVAFAMIEISRTYNEVNFICSRIDGIPSEPIHHV